jgi:hypothetical protein
MTTMENPMPKKDTTFPNSGEEKLKWWEAELFEIDNENNPVELRDFVRKIMEKEYKRGARNQAELDASAIKQARNEK